MLDVLQDEQELEEDANVRKGVVEWFVVFWSGGLSLGNSSYSR